MLVAGLDPPSLPNAELLAAATLLLGPPNVKAELLAAAALDAVQAGSSVERHSV